MADAKEMWEALRFGGNDESKKVQKYLLKQQFKGFLCLPQRVCINGTTVSLSNTQNVAFVSAKNTSSTNDVSIAYSISSLSVSKLQKEGSSSYTDEVIHSFSNQSSAPQLDYNDLEKINDDDMEEMDLKWQVAMISMRIKKFYKKTGRKLQFDTKDPVDFYKTKVECFNCHKIRHFARDCRAKGNQDSRRSDVGYNGNKTRDNGRRPAYQDDSKALVTINGEDIDWSEHVEEDAQNNAMMAYSSSNLEALKEKEDLKTKFENWQNSSKNLSKLLNTQMSANDKFGLGYGDYRYGSILSYENKVLQSVFMNNASDLEDIPVNDRFADGMHAVPPPMTGKYMPFGPDVEIDYSKFTYGLKQTSADESYSKPSKYVCCESDSSVETSTSIPEPVENASKVVCEPKLWTDAHIIEEYESDSDNDSVFNVQEDKEKPSFAFTDYVKHVKTSRENIKETGTTNHSPKIKKQDRNGHTKKGLGYDFTRKACFVCGSSSHLIRDYDFHKKRMAKQAELTKSKNKDDPHRALKDKGIVDSGCSRNMQGTKLTLLIIKNLRVAMLPLEGKHQGIFYSSYPEVRHLEAELNADINWNAVIEKVKRSESEIISLFEKHYNYNQAFLVEVDEEVKVPEKEVEVESHKREGESLEKEITKKQKMDEEAEELKSHLQIVSNDDDDVYTEATPLASKIPIVDYKIHLEINKPYFKIIKADGNQMLFLSFSTLLNNFDKEDLESLWKLVKERFEKTEPNNHTDDYLLKTLKTILNSLMLKPVYGEIKRVEISFDTFHSGANAE
nr:hypothetical protein [Tanacetum cinerariifolium]